MTPLSIPSITQASLDVLCAKDLGTLLEIAVGAFSHFGISNFGFATYELDGTRVKSPALLTSRGPGFLDDYRSHAEHDVYAKAAASGSPAFTWSWLDKSENVANARHLDFMADHGAQSGVYLPFYVSERGCNGVVFTSSSKAICDAGQLQQAFSLAVTIQLKLESMSFNDQVPEPEPGFSPPTPLSPRQFEVLKWVSEGKSSSDIAIILSMKKATVDYHVARILLKLNVASRAQAIAHYIKHGA